MKAKIGLILLAAIVVSAWTGVSYSFCNGNPVDPLIIDPDVAFVGTVTAYDNEVGKNIGTVTASLTGPYGDGLYNGIAVEILSAYPGYIAYIDFTVENTGDVPINVRGLVSDVYDHNAMSISLAGNIATISQLQAGESVSGTAVITVLNDALQNNLYAFSVGILFDYDPT